MDERSRVKVDATSGMVEVEGSEAFVREMLERFASLTEHAPKTKDQDARQRGKPRRKAEAKEEPPPPRGSKRSTGGRLDLDEPLKRDIQEHGDAFSAYLNERRLRSQKEEAAAIAGFLQSTLERPAMNDKEYVTALRVLGRRLPKNPRQVLLDAKNKKGFFHEDGASFGLTAAGMHFVEHDSLKREGSD